MRSGTRTIRSHGADFTTQAIHEALVVPVVGRPGDCHHMTVRRAQRMEVGLERVVQHRDPGQVFPVNKTGGRGRDLDF